LLLSREVTYYFVFYRHQQFSWEWNPIGQFSRCPLVVISMIKSFELNYQRFRPPFYVHRSLSYLFAVAKVTEEFVITLHHLLLGETGHVVGKGGVLLKIYAQIEKLFISRGGLIASQTLSNRGQLSLKKISDLGFQLHYVLLSHTLSKLEIGHQIVINLVNQPHEKLMRVMVLLIVEEFVPLPDFLHKGLVVEHLSVFLLLHHALEKLLKVKDKVVFLFLVGLEI
jgi:hypothetical protein